MEPAIITKMAPFLTDFPTEFLGRKPKSQLERIEAEIEQNRSKSISDLALLFEPVIPSDTFTDIADKYDGKINVSTTIWAWLSQVFECNGSCQKAVSLIQAWLSESNSKKRYGAEPKMISSNTSAYCQSRQALPEEAIDYGLELTVDYVNKLIKEEQLWRGFQIKAIDGSSTKLLDTQANQEKYQQPPQQSEGCGFPVMGFGGVLNLSTGCVEALQIGKYTQNDLVAAHELIDMFSPGDLLLADRAYNSYGFVVQLFMKGVHSVMRLNESRIGKNFWNKGKRVGKGQRLVRWKKPRRKSDCMTKEEWDQLPAEIEMRYVRVKAPDRNGEMRNIYIATSLLDHEKYPADEIAWLYQKRWDIEVKFRDIKTTLGYEMCRVNSPEMAEKTMKMVMLAYNLIKAIQAKSIFYGEVLLDRISFKQTVDLVMSFRPLFLGHQNHPNKKNEIRNEIYNLVEKSILPQRSRPTEPRVVKTRLKYDLMTISRQKFKTQIRHELAIS